MKIYSRLVLDIESGQVLEAASSEYDGAVAFAKGGKVSIPGPSQAEQDLMAKQTEILQQQKDIIQAQYEQQNMLAPFLYKSIGIEPVIDPETGKITSFKESTDPTKILEKDIQTKFLERTQAALKGELPLDPTLIKELDTQERVLHETLRKQLGPGYETSTPGQAALAEFQKNKAGLYSAASRGDLTLAESLGIARTGSNEQKLSDFIARTTGVANQPLNTASAFGANAAGYNAPLGRMQQNRAMQTQAMLMNAQSNASSFGDLFKGIGGLAGQAFLGGSKPWIFG